MLLHKNHLPGQLKFARMVQLCLSKHEILAYTAGIKYSTMMVI